MPQMGALQPGETVAVVGAGIIGVTIAVELQRRGFRPVLIEQSGPGSGASYGNMASIAVTEFLPGSRPSIWAHIPKWLLDPVGPVAMRGAYLPKLAPWLLRFVAAGMPHRLHALERAGAALSKRVFDDLLPLLNDVGLSDFLSDCGCISIYGDEGEFAADRERLAALHRHGFEYRVLDRSEIFDLEPALSGAVAKGVLLPTNKTVSDPFRLVVALHERFMLRGGRSVTGKVDGFERCEAGVTALRFSDGRQINVAGAVLCAGAETGALARLLGEPIPLETERGYHTQIQAPGVALSHSLIWPARAFMVTPTAGGLRVGGSVELAGLNAPPNFARARVLVDHARTILPGLIDQEASQWMGHRPALPDTIPLIGPSGTTRRVWYATGHGHLGLTHAATTARLIADLLTGDTPPIDMRPYSIERFKRF